MTEHDRRQHLADAKSTNCIIHFGDGYRVVAYGPINGGCWPLGWHLERNDGQGWYGANDDEQPTDSQVVELFTNWATQLTERADRLAPSTPA